METQMSYFQKHPDVTKSSFNTFMFKGQFEDISIHASIFEVHVTGSPNVELEVCSVPEQERMTFEHAIKQEFKPIKNRHLFGPSWGLTSGNGNNRWHKFILTSKAGAKEERHILYLEVTCNGMFGLGDYMIGPPDSNCYFTLQPVELIVKHPKAHVLYHDLVVLSQIINDLSKDSSHWWQGLSTVNKVMTAYDMTDKNSLDTCLVITSEFFKAKTGNAAHQVYAIGNCHI
ncbi:Glycoside hydrolase, 38 vacuolar alpha mannosidase, partial [Coemansia erecta]